MGRVPVLGALLVLVLAYAAARECTLTDGVLNRGGHNLQRSRVGRWGQVLNSPEECRDACDKEGACRAFSYKLSTKECFLSSATGDEVDHVDWASGECAAGTNLAIDKPADCWEAKLSRKKNDQGHYGSGTYTIWPVGSSNSNGIKVACNQDVEGGGWTYLMNRVDATYFGHGIYYYKNGFGSRTPWSSHWIGLEYMHQITRAATALRVEIQGILNWRWDTRAGVYRRFSVSNEASGYTLQVADFNDFGLGNGMWYHSGRPFVTRDWGWGWRWCSQVQGYNWWWWWWYGMASNEAPGFWYGWCWWVNPTAKWGHFWNYWFGFSTWRGWSYTFWGNYWRWPWWYGHRMDRIVFLAKPASEVGNIPYMKLVSAPISVSRHRFVASNAQLVSSGSYSWMFFLRVEEVAWYWKNIMQKGYWWWERNIAVWNYPGTTRLYFSTGLAWWWWWGFLSNAGVRLFKWTHVALMHDFNGVRLFLDGKLDTNIQFGWYWAFASSNWNHLYASDPWHHPLRSKIAQMEYKPAVATTIRKMKQETRRAISMNKPKNVVHWTALLRDETKPALKRELINPKTTSELTGYTWTWWIKLLSTSHRRVAAVIRRGNQANQNSIKVVLGRSSSTMYIYSAQPGQALGTRAYPITLPLGQWTHIAFTHQWGEIMIYVNGNLVGNDIGNHIGQALHNAGPVTLGASDSNNEDSADAIVTGVEFANAVGSRHRLKARIAKDMKKFYADQAAIEAAIAQEKAEKLAAQIKAAALRRKRQEEQAKVVEKANKAELALKKERQGKEKKKKEVDLKAEKAAKEKEKKRQEDIREKQLKAFQASLAKLKLAAEERGKRLKAEQRRKEKKQKEYQARLLAIRRQLERRMKARKKPTRSINKKVSKKLTAKASKRTRQKYAKKKNPKKLKKSSSGQSKSSMSSAPKKTTVSKQTKASRTKRAPQRKQPKPIKTPKPVIKKPKRRKFRTQVKPIKISKKKLAAMYKAEPVRPVVVKAKPKAIVLPVPKITVTRRQLARLTTKWVKKRKKLIQSKKYAVEAKKEPKNEKFFEEYKEPPKSIKKLATRPKRRQRRQKPEPAEEEPRPKRLQRRQRRQKPITKPKQEKKQKKSTPIVRVPGKKRTKAEKKAAKLKKAQKKRMKLVKESNIRLLHKLQAMAVAAHSQGKGAVGGQVSGNGPQFIYNIMGRASERRCGGDRCRRKVNNEGPVF